MKLSSQQKRMTEIFGLLSQDLRYVPGEQESYTLTARSAAGNLIRIFSPGLLKTKSGGRGLNNLIENWTV